MPSIMQASIESIAADSSEQSTKNAFPDEMSMESRFDSNLCAGCNQPILDRYYLLAIDRRWHSHCLKCSECHVSLDAERSCFSRDGRIFCKEDYYRIFIVKRCNRCGQCIIANDLAMRVQELYFHIHCFTCAWCNEKLMQGDYFGIGKDSLVYCQIHFELRLATEQQSDLYLHDHDQHHQRRQCGTFFLSELAAHPTTEIPTMSNQMSSSMEEPQLTVLQPFCSGRSKITATALDQPSDHEVLAIADVEKPGIFSLAAFSATEKSRSGLIASNECSMKRQPKRRQRTTNSKRQGPASNLEDLVKSEPDTNGTVAATGGRRQKAEDPETMASSAECSSNSGQRQPLKDETPTLAPEPAGKQRARQQPPKRSANNNSGGGGNNATTIVGESGQPGASIEVLVPPVGGGSVATSSSAASSSAALSPAASSASGSFSPHRPKRMRTSFKHHQLRQMKEYFAINHNPDSKELRALAQKTNLSKRVLQVWFQNARAKWRRSIIRGHSDGPHIVQESSPLNELQSNNVQVNGHLGANKLEPMSSNTFSCSQNLFVSIELSGRAAAVSSSPNSVATLQVGGGGPSLDHTEQPSRRVTSSFIGSPAASCPSLLLGSCSPMPGSGYGRSHSTAALDKPAGSCCFGQFDDIDSPSSIASLTITQEEQHGLSFFAHHQQQQSLY